MALVEKMTGSGDVTNNGYYRIFDTPLLSRDIIFDMAQLVSKIHGASISNGSILESFIIDPRFNKNPITPPKKGLQCVLENTNGHYPKVKISADLLKTKGFELKGKNNIEIDYIVVKDNELHVYEIKDGDAFDTKKSEAEYQSIVMVKSFFETLGIFKKVHGAIVLWNSRDLSKASFKSIKGKGIIMRGVDFCEKSDIDFESLNNSRKFNNLLNVNYVLNTMDNIHKRFSSQQTQISQLEKLRISKDKLLLIGKKENSNRIQAHINRKVKAGESLESVVSETNSFVSETTTREKLKQLANSDEKAASLLKRMRSGDKNTRTLALSDAITYFRTLQ